MSSKPSKMTAHSNEGINVAVWGGVIAVTLPEYPLLSYRCLKWNIL
jgi:hypothetical protein